MTELISLQDWRQWWDEFKLLPYVSVHPLETVSWDWLDAWDEAKAYSFVLESGKGGRYSYLGLAPESIIRGKDCVAEVIEYQSAGTKKSAPIGRGTPWELVQQWMGDHHMPKLRMNRGIPPFIGGCVGYWAYDAARTILPLPNDAKDDLELPDFLFMKFHELYIIDHAQQELYCSVITSMEGLSQEEAILTERFDQASQRAMRMKLTWDQMMGEAGSKRSIRRVEALQKLEFSTGMDGDPERMMGVVQDFSRQQFIQAVEQIQESIRLGDVDQVNLSLRQHRRLHTSPEEIYEWLRLVNPSPYMGMLRFPDFQIVSGSPELLVKLRGHQVTTRPIGGTRKRSGEEAEDLHLKSELAANDKERSEHLMLVELLSHDLEQIAKEGSVQVEELMVIESYSHVHHLVSLISGVLAEPYHTYDVIRAMFPGGSITGSPKQRTMELIEELEPVRRGIYTGSIGWIDYSGDMEFNIVIRTLLVKDQIGYVQTGAGIVSDSIPEREYEESIQKSKALWKAVSLSEVAK